VKSLKSAALRRSRPPGPNYRRLRRGEWSGNARPVRV